MAERPQHELVASPWLTNGQIAAIRVAVMDSLETTESWLDDDDADLVRGMVRRGETLDLSLLTGVVTPEERYFARLFFWLLQADRALMTHLTPITVQGPNGGVVWTDGENPIDPLPQKGEA
jgi:hypothetical protein